MATIVQHHEFPAKVFFHSADPQALLDAGYDSLRIEKRKTCNDAWKLPSLTDPQLCDLELRPDQLNYHFLDANSLLGNQYRAVLQNSAVPGTPADVPQPVTNAVDTAFEAIMSVQEFRDLYAWGQDNGFITDDGNFWPDYAFVHNILYGIAKVERTLDIRLLPKRFVERRDWTPEAWRRTGYMQLILDEGPILSLESLTLKLGVGDSEFPLDWCHIKRGTKQVDVVPNTSTTFNVPFVRTSAYVPAGLEVAYIAGFDLSAGRLPEDLLEAVGIEAALGPLNMAGDLIGGAGLAGTSLSMDGLSQSVTTTNSSTNAGFGAKILQLKSDVKNLYKILRPTYKGIGLRSV